MRSFRCPYALCIESVARHLCSQQDLPTHCPSSARGLEVSLNVLVEPRASHGVGGVADGVAATSSGVGLTRPAVAAVVPRPPRVVRCIPLAPRRYLLLDYAYGTGDRRLGGRCAATRRAAGAVARSLLCSRPLSPHPLDRALSVATGALPTPLTSTCRCSMASNITSDRAEAAVAAAASVRADEAASRAQ